MNAIVGRREPTPGQLALAATLASGGTRREGAISHVDAAVYTDPARHVAERDRIFRRARW